MARNPTKKRVGPVTKADLNRKIAELRQALKESKEYGNTLREALDSKEITLDPTPVDPEALALPSGISSFQEMLKEFARREAVIIAQEEKMGYAVPATWEGAVLPNVRENTRANDLERTLNEVNRNYTKLYNQKRGEGTVDVAPPPKIVEKPQPNLPVECNNCGDFVPNRFEGAKNRPEDGQWYCIGNGCAAEKNLV